MPPCCSVEMGHNMSNELDYRWINDPYERPASEKKKSEDYVNFLNFRYLKKTGTKPENVMDKVLSGKYSEWLKTNP